MDDIVDEVVIPGFSSADWVHVETADGDVGFLPRMHLAPAEASPLIEDDFFLQCRIAALSAASRTDHHYLYALAFGESKVQNKPADPASGSVGPFQYTTQRWIALAGPTGKESDWGEQIGIAALEASSQAAKIAQQLNRDAIYADLYLMHVLNNLAAFAALQPEAPDIAAVQASAEQQVQQILQHAGVNAAGIDLLEQTHPDLFKPVNAVEAATAALQQGFERAAVLAQRLDPPELNPTPAPASDPSIPTNFPSPDQKKINSIAKHKAEAQRVLDALFATEWTKPQVIGIIANIFRESGFNPSIPGDGGQAYGLCQWHPDRQKEFFHFKGKSIKGSTFEDQVQFSDHELRHNEKRAGDLLKRQSSASGAGYVISLYYERPAGRESTARSRGGVAEEFARILSG
jgi:DNA-binding NarL/FixJ family response regulator